MFKFSFWARDEQLVHIQQVVKRYDLRFHNNPAAYGAGIALVEIVHEGNDVSRWHAAMREIGEIPHPSKPPQPVGRFRRMWQRIFG